MSSKNKGVATPPNSHDLTAGHGRSGRSNTEPISVTDEPKSANDITSKQNLGYKHTGACGRCPTLYGRHMCMCIYIYIYGIYIYV